jgi:hypothetical protein
MPKAKLKTRRAESYAISDLTTNHTFAGRSANRRMYQRYHAEP